MSCVQPREKLQAKTVGRLNANDRADEKAIEELQVSRDHLCIAQDVGQDTVLLAVEVAQIFFDELLEGGRRTISQS